MLRGRTIIVTDAIPTGSGLHLARRDIIGYRAVATEAPYGAITIPGYEYAVLQMLNGPLRSAPSFEAHIQFRSWRNSAGVCRCDAYPFPHHTGKGHCTVNRKTEDNTDDQKPDNADPENWDV